MTIINHDQTVAILTTQEFHDQLGMVNAFLDEGDADQPLVVVESIIVNWDADITNEDFTKLSSLVSRYNGIMTQLAILDAEFHEIFDGDYC